MRGAVEVLKSQPQTEYIGLSAIANYRSEKYGFRLRAAPLIELNKIIGRTPNELWEMYDVGVTRQIKYFEVRFSK